MKYAMVYEMIPGGSRLDRK